MSVNFEKVSLKIFIFTAVRGALVAHSCGPLTGMHSLRLFRDPELISDRWVV